MMLIARAAADVKTLLKSPSDLIALDVKPENSWSRDVGAAQFRFAADGRILTALPTRLTMSQGEPFTGLKLKQVLNGDLSLLSPNPVMPNMISVSKAKGSLIGLCQQICKPDENSNLSLTSKCIRRPNGSFFVEAIALELNATDHTSGSSLKIRYEIDSSLKPKGTISTSTRGLTKRFLHLQHASQLNQPPSATYFGETITGEQLLGSQTHTDSRLSPSAVIENLLSVFQDPTSLAKERNLNLRDVRENNFATFQMKARAGKTKLTNTSFLTGKIDSAQTPHNYMQALVDVLGIPLNFKN